MRKRRPQARSGEQIETHPQEGSDGTSAASSELVSAPAELREPATAVPIADPWAPIVVGEPVFDFEPKPPSPTDTYRPDTIFDGWSAGQYTIRMASVRGYAHRYSGSPRQDDAAAAFEPGSGAVIFAVADGVSSAPES